MFNKKASKKTKVITIKFIILIIVKHNKCFGVVSFSFQTIDCMSSGFWTENVLNFFFLYDFQFYLIHNEIRQCFSTRLVSLLKWLLTQSLVWLVWMFVEKNQSKCQIRWISEICHQFKCSFNLKLIVLIW